MKYPFAHLLFYSLLWLQPFYAQPTEAATTECDYADDYEEEEDKTYTREEQATALEVMKDVYAQQLSILRNITDKESADAAADSINQQAARLTPELLQIIASAECDKIMAIGISEALTHQAQPVLNQLKQQYYFGSTTLAKRLAGSAAFAAPPSPMPQEVQQQFISTSTHKAGRNTEITATGGPGFTRDSAWQLSFPLHPMAKESVRLYIESTINFSAIELQKWAWNPPQLNLVFADNKVYYHFLVDLYNAGDALHAARYELEQWFDLSAAFPFASEAEWYTKLNQLMDNTQRLCKELKKVQDKETADAAAARVKSVVADIRANYAAYYLLDQDTPRERELRKKLSRHFAVMMKEMNRIRKADMFGSEPLQKVIKTSSK